MHRICYNSYIICQKSFILVKKCRKAGIFVMRILVFSDSHRDVQSCLVMINKIAGVDMVIHAGDHAADAEDLQMIFPDIDVRFVCGNCDFSKAPAELLFKADGKNIFLTHGHLHNVKYDSEYKTLADSALEKNADIAVFGHTHKPFYKNTGNLILLNPGSIRYGRTFGIIETDAGKLRADICDLNTWL